MALAWAKLANIMHCGWFSENYWPKSKDTNKHIYCRYSSLKIQIIHSLIHSFIQSFTHTHDVPMCLLWDIKQDILKNVGNKTVLVSIDFYCMVFCFSKYLLLCSTDQKYFGMTMMMFFGTIPLIVTSFSGHSSVWRNAPFIHVT